MSKIYDDITKTVGNTPLVKLNRVTAGLKATILAKLESIQSAFQRQRSPGSGAY